MSPWVNVGGIELPTDAQVETLIDERKGAPQGIASLDAAGRVPDAELPDRLGEAALSATIAAEIATEVAPIRDATLYGGRVVIDGDSVTRDSIFVGPAVGAGNQNRAESWTVEFARISQGVVQLLWVSAVAGATSAARLAAFDTDVAPHSPDTVILAVGTNDTVQGVAMSEWLANLAAYAEKCEAIGARLVLLDVWPTDQTSVVPTRGQIAREWNAALHPWAAARGIDVVPVGRLTDPANGGWVDGWDTDQIHPYTPAGRRGIAQFVWTYLAPKFGPAIVRRPVCQGDGLFGNGFFLNLTAGIDGGAVQASTSLASAAGALPAGTYDYRITARTNYGESGQYVEKSITLAAVGGVTVTRVINNFYNAWNVYRKGPGENAFRLVATVPNATATWTDDGSATPGHEWIGENNSRVPVGLTTAIGTSSYHSLKRGGPVQQVAGISGNVLLLAPYTAGTTDPEDFFEVTGLTPGQTLEFSCLMASAGGAYAQALLRFRTPGGTSPAAVSAYRGVAGPVIAPAQLTRDHFGIVWLRAIVPDGADRVRISFGLDDTAEYIAAAEVGLWAVSS